MEIMVAKHAGFCFGVKKAIEIAEKTAESEKTFVYGQLVHNERVIEDLEKKGIRFIDDIGDIPENAVTVLRAHGEPGTTYRALKSKNMQSLKKHPTACLSGYTSLMSLLFLMKSLFT